MKLKFYIALITLLFSIISSAKNTGLTKEQILQTIRKDHKGLIKCYDDQNLLSSNLKGKIIIAFEIGNEGKPLNSSIDYTSLNNLIIESCILDRSKNWQFPKPKGNDKVKVKFPFVFDKTMKL